MMLYACSSMHSDVDAELGDLEAQLVSKEKEWKELQAARVHQLECLLRKSQEECCSLRERLKQMKEDFQFNLALLDERDRELEKYDVVTSRALAIEDNRQQEMKRLRLQVSQLEEQRRREAERWQEELSKSQRSAVQHQLQLEKLKLSIAAELQQRTEDSDRVKLDLQCRIRDVEGHLELQRQELTAAFDSELKQREHQFNVKMDDMRAVVLSHELRVKLLSNEVEVHSQAQLQAVEALKSSQQFCQQIQTQLQHKEQEIKDLSDIKDCRVRELDNELKLMETKVKEGEKNHMKKYNDLIGALKECEAQKEAQRLAHTEQLQTAEKHIVKLQEDLKVQAAQTRGLQREQQDTMKEKDATIHRLHTEVERIRSGWDKYLAQVSSEMVVKDTEMITLQETETKLRVELERSREEMEGYKQQLSAGLKREQALEQKRVQVELEWHRRCEDVKAELYLSNEQLIQDLTQARDQTKAELKEKEHELQDLTVLLRSIKMERDQAMQGLTPKVDYLASEEIHCLQEQNSVLRTVVNQMRKDMEGLSHLPLHPQTASPQPVHQQAASSANRNTQMASRPPGDSTDLSSKISPAVYTEALEQEVSLLKARCRNLQAQLEGATGPHRLAPAADKHAENPSHQNNVQHQGQGEAVGCLQRGQYTSALEKQDVRVSNAESSTREQVLKESALLRQLQEENIRLRQQQASGVKSGGMHSRLKQAALCISRLSLEKQQLITMGNRLRALIAAAGLQEAAEPQRDTFTETQGEQPSRLSALEQLQYQLTTQELQFALRQRDGASAEQILPENHSQNPATEGTANPWIQGHEPPSRPEPLSGPSRSLLSSEESLRSLKELWEKLDHGLSPSIFSEADGQLSSTEVPVSSVAGVQMMMQGVSVPIHGQPPSEAKQRRNPSTSNTNKTKSRSGPSGRISKIRNYNVKD